MGLQIIYDGQTPSRMGEYRHEDHQPVKEAYESLGDTFVVDYVRVFDEVE